MSRNLRLFFLARAAVSALTMQKAPILRKFNIDASDPVRCYFEDWPSSVRGSLVTYRVRKENKIHDHEFVRCVLAGPSLASCKWVCVSPRIDVHARLVFTSLVMCLSTPIARSLTSWLPLFWPLYILPPGGSQSRLNRVFAEVATATDRPLFARCAAGFTIVGSRQGDEEFPKPLRLPM